MKAILLLFAACCALSPQQSATAPVNYSPIDLEPHANRKLTDNQGSGADGNDLAALPRGEREFAGIKFRVGAKAAQGSALPDQICGPTSTDRRDGPSTRRLPKVPCPS
jgi:hypothetical protein